MNIINIMTFFSLILSLVISLFNFRYLSHNYSNFLMSWMFRNKWVKTAKIELFTKTTYENRIFLPEIADIEKFIHC